MRMAASKPSPIISVIASLKCRSIDIERHSATFAKMASPSRSGSLAMIWQGSATDRTSPDFVVIHPLDPEDAAITTATRAMASSAKGAPRGIEARVQFDALMESVLPRDDVTFEADTLGDIPGIWVHPANWRSDEAIVHLHGGWFNFGSAKAYRHLVGHIAARAGARAFIPDYRLAPEHPFPAATDDVLACYRGFAGSGVRRIALTGDSAGGNLAMVLASRVIGEAVSDSCRNGRGVAGYRPDSSQRDL
jgi:monoterpene epsilon-lactone hydrolase